MASTTKATNATIRADNKARAAKATPGSFTRPQTQAPAVKARFAPVPNYDSNGKRTTKGVNAKEFGKAVDAARATGMARVKRQVARAKDDKISSTTGLGFVAEPSRPKRAAK